MTLGIICARAGSQGLPNKNIRPLLGVPLIEWAVQVALESQVDEVAVCTDIPRSAWSYAIPSIDRPEHLRGPHVSKWDVWKYVAEVSGADSICDIDVTRPLKTAQDIDGCLALHHAGAPVAMAVARARKSPYFDIMEPADGGVALSKPSTYTTRQECPPAYYHGGVYVMTAEALQTRSGIFDGPVAAYEIPEDNAWDIDDETDWRIVEMLARGRASV